MAYEQYLIQAGLTSEQAQVYEVLLKIGPSPAKKVAQNTTFKRSTVYKFLEDLVNLGLVTRKDEVGKVSVFEPAHPLKLKDLAESRQQQAKNAQIALDAVLGQMTSDFNLISGRPGVRFYEGLDKALEVTNDSLKTKSEIYTYIDSETVNRYYPKINQEYITKRVKLNVKKKIITVDTPFVREHAKHFNPQITQIKAIDSPISFATVMQIYDNKVTYIAMDENKVVSIVIEQGQIAQMHKTLFEALWKQAKPILSENPINP